MLIVDLGVHLKNIIKKSLLLQQGNNQHGLLDQSLMVSFEIIFKTAKFGFKVIHCVWSPNYVLISSCNPIDLGRVKLKI